MTAPSSSKTRRTTITPTALHHYQGRNWSVAAYPPPTGIGLRAKSRVPLFKPPTSRITPPLPTDQRNRPRGVRARGQRRISGRAVAAARHVAAVHAQAVTPRPLWWQLRGVGGAVSRSH